MSILLRVLQLRIPLLHNRELRVVIGGSFSAAFLFYWLNGFFFFFWFIYRRKLHRMLQQWAVAYVQSHVLLRR